MFTTQQKVPGIYREDIFAPPPPELLTGVPVFLGFATQGFFGQPQRLTLWTHFADTFGTPAPNSFFSAAVEGFFNNGGKMCYGLRLNPDVLRRDAIAHALESLESLDEIDLVCAPDLVQPGQTLEQVQILQAMILEHCDRTGDRFAILDAYFDWAEVQLITSSAPPGEPNRIAILNRVQQQQQHLSSINGALYFPWIQVDNTTATTFIPPCGHIAGVYARNDQTAGAHQAPANYVLQGVVDFNLLLTNQEQALLNPEERGAGINCLRSFPGRGMRVWGSRTLSQQDATWRYINIRRLFLMVGRWLERNLTSVTFEPNDFRLWVRIEREITAYLESLQQQGAFQGRVAKESFYVKCDAETNPPEIQAAGKVIIEIGLAPTVPSEFIVVRLIHGDTGVTLTQ